jgi:hypothetical protein
MNESRDEMKLLMKLFLGPEPAERLYEKWEDSIPDDEEFKQRAMTLMQAVVGRSALKSNLPSEISENNP